ncbi:hypothetical protein [Paraburkholderia graminis]|uniref:hypothetical protein n=1 Tax=Paraburkholderia graminis TaxID=60548 RepID=UPI0038BB6F9A
MSNDLISRMPAILATAASKAKRARLTGEITVDGAAIRKAAIDTGYTNRITNAQLGVAVAAAGGSLHTKTRRGARYVFKGALTIADALDSAATSVQRTLANHKVN